MKDTETELCALPQLLLIDVLQTTQTSSARPQTQSSFTLHGWHLHPFTNTLEASIVPVIVLSLACQQLLLINTSLVHFRPCLRLSTSAFCGCNTMESLGLDNS